MTGSQGRPAFDRRALIGTGLGAAVLLAAGSGTARAADRAQASARSRAQAFLAAAMDAYPDHGTIRLAQSYTDQAGLFSTAFTYDNALAILANLACDTKAGRSRAAALGDALLYAQANDPDHDDGRLRQAYNVGPYTFYDGTPQPDGFVRADGKANVGWQFGFTGTAVGDMAWAGIALATLARRTGSAASSPVPCGSASGSTAPGAPTNPSAVSSSGSTGRTRSSRSPRPSTTPT